ncbi:2897_t:CDS:2 [Funneliformis geosporum]|uniref:Mediator of RNA polymerase II transcription subunit 10 n=1 Tax=Funneliformis geosporum TaxID=1117311 RepID=A0A9W4WT98_9GLOM|nr:4264_t:CDS:2 [Funneliformis geosporum]CAI2184269.1 2897_t:CDS:2 [Funneliformis geosporum]
MGPMMMATASEPEQPPQQNGHNESRDSRTTLELTIDNLLTKIWEIMVQLNDYNPENKWALSKNLSELADQFDKIHKLQEKIKHIEVPLEVIEYIDEGRNPDKFMVDYVDEVIKENESVNIKNEAIQNFSELLLEQLQESFPEQTDCYKQYQSSKSKKTNGH